MTNTIVEYRYYELASIKMLTVLKDLNPQKNLKYIKIFIFHNFLYYTNSIDVI